MRPDPAQRGYDHKWRRTRGRYLKHHPACEHPGCTRPATDVHHLDNQGPLAPNGHKWNNLQALCHTHHSRHTAQQQPAGWNTTPPRNRPPTSHPGLVQA